MQVITNRLRELREAKSMSQLTMAMLSGVQQAHISVIENHHYFPSARARSRLAEALNVTEAEIWPVLAKV